ncbi:uncharacterized protein LOC103496880 [Cucumis melo]|uniref:Uncharacterized protein LOC103496880 n=1 Tax=Cucumis melo TaxID=3656 RepID=A0A1S4E258_CUCME|nr:uncharacterized protein LOC103496880 [Cucumis melo]
MWGRHEGVSPLVSLMRNLQHLKPTLRRHFGRHIHNLSKEVHNAKEAMDRAQREVERNSMSDVLSRQTGLATETFWTAVRLEEASLRQKSRIRWLELGDQNTAFFHRSVRSRMSRNSLLVDSDGSRVSSHDGVVQLVPISREEVRRVLFSMDSGKAPGPDGFSVGFFKGAWSMTCYLQLGVNATTITLIPKLRGAERMEEFRPISCCNVIYKCISKILADRICVWLPSFISSNQSAFMPGRSIIDNILLCQELVGGYHLNFGKPRYTLKVDLQKAYDSVNWDFLFGLLIAIGTPLKFERCKARKSSIFVAGVSHEAASHLAASMGFGLGNLPVRYLGLPLLTGRLRSNDCAPLIQRITSWIRSWTARVLSFFGTLQLVRSVLHSLQVYWASMFVLPAYVHNEVDKILRSYLWRGKEEGRGGFKVAWVEVCLPFEEGELAIQDGPSWNIARGPILEQVGERVFYDAASRREARLSDFIGLDGEWQWPRVSMELIDLWDRVQAVSPCLSVRDRWVWIPGRQGGFSIASTWETIRPRGGRVRWASLLWGGENIPKHSFCAWLAIKDMLGTRDRLHRWDSSVSMCAFFVRGC